MVVNRYYKGACENCQQIFDSILSVRQQPAWRQKTVTNKITLQVGWHNFCCQYAGRAARGIASKVSASVLQRMSLGRKPLGGNNFSGQHYAFMSKEVHKSPAPNKLQTLQSVQHLDPNSEIIKLNNSLKVFISLAYQLITFYSTTDTWKKKKYLNPVI